MLSPKLLSVCSIVAVCLFSLASQSFAGTNSSAHEVEPTVAFSVGLRELAREHRVQPLVAMKLRRAANNEAICEQLAAKYACETCGEMAEVDMPRWLNLIWANREAIINFVLTMLDWFDNTTYRVRSVVRGTAERVFEIPRNVSARARTRAYHRRAVWIAG